MYGNLSEPLDDEEFARLDEFLLERVDDETGDRICAAGGDYQDRDYQDTHQFAACAF